MEVYILALLKAFWFDLITTPLTAEEIIKAYSTRKVDARVEENKM